MKASGSGEERDDAKAETLAKRKRAFALILQGWSDREVAEELGVTRTTVWKWRTAPKFAGRLQRAMESATKDAQAKVQALASRAVDALAETLGCSDPKARVAAAKTILDRVLPTSSEQENERFHHQLLEVFGVLSQKLPPEEYARAIEALRDARIGTTKRLPAGLTIRVERA